MQKCERQKKHFSFTLQKFCKYEHIYIKKKKFSDLKLYKMRSIKNARIEA